MMRRTPLKPRHLRVVGEPPPRSRHPQRTDPEFLSYVRAMACMFDTTQNPCDGTTEPHHFPHKGMGGKNGDDRLTVPACQKHHREWHDHGTIAPWERIECERAMLRKQLSIVLAWMDR